MLELQKLVENKDELHRHPISQSIKEVVNKIKITNGMLVDLEEELDKIIDQQTKTNNQACKEKLITFNKTVTELINKLNCNITINTANKIAIQNAIKDTVVNLKSASVIEKITVIVAKLKTGKITKGKLIDLKEEVEEFMDAQTSKEANNVLTWSVKEIVYDTPLLNYPGLLELALCKFSLQKIGEFSNKFSYDLVQEIINNDNSELALAGFMSLMGNAEI